MKGFFIRFYHFFNKKPFALTFTLVALVFALGWSVLRLDFVEDISSFLPSSPQNQRINDAYEHLGGDNKIVISFSQKDTAGGVDYELLCAAADRLADRLQSAEYDALVKSVLCEVDEFQIHAVMAFVVENMPYLLSESDYARMDTLLTPMHIAQQLDNDKQLLASPLSVMRPLIQRDPLFFSSALLQSLQAFKPDDNYHVENGHIFNKAGTEALVVVTSNFPLSETKNNKLLLQRIDQEMAAVTREMENAVQMTSFGASQISITNASQIKKDSLVSIALSMVIIMALLIYYYRNFRSILLILVSIGFGGLFALGLIAWIQNPVSLIALGMASIILGIAINYPIHFLSHFKRTDDKEQIIKEIVTPLLIGNITTVGAFLSLLFISSPAMKDLGLFAALLLVGTILFVLLFLPHLMGNHYQGKARGLAFRSIAEFRWENLKGIFWIILALTIALGCFTSRTAFDTNMHHINYMTESQRAMMERMTAEADTSLRTLYCVAEGSTLDEALAHNEIANQAIRRIAAQYPIRKQSGVGDLLPSKSMQQHRLALWETFWKERRESFCTDLSDAASKAGFSAQAFQPCYDILSSTYTVQEQEYFDIIRETLAASYISTDSNRTLIYNVLQVDKSVAAAVEKELNQVHGQVFAFTDSSIASRLVTALSHDFDYVLYICGFIVFAFLLFTFGSFEISIMAFLPLFTAWVWILGIMGLSGLSFNIVNIILATFIFGMGDDYSIFVTEGLIYEYSYGKKMLAQFKNSIILSASIMFVSIGMLIFAKHPAMRSLAEVTIIGMFCVVLMAYIVPPIIFKWLTTMHGKPRKRPVTLRSLFRSLIGFPYFFMGVVILWISGFFILRLGGRSDKHKLRYHKVLRQLLYSTAKIIPNSPFKIVNPQKEDFSKPAVLICNHQSHFDLMYTLMLAPNIIVLTNDWAWNMPLYRRILRNADYIPTSKGLDTNFDKIKQMTEKGYSVLVFPEGTRSADHQILRFHQGAFSLANELNLDIIPIIAHGIGDMFPKYDTCIHCGNVTITIGERITPDNPDFRGGKSTRETAQCFRRYYTARYAAIKEACETPAYLKDFVHHNYIYKGKEVQIACRRKLSQMETLIRYIDQMPDNQRVLYKHCGNGELSLLTALYRKRWEIVAYDEEEDAVSIAAHCASVPANLSYTHELPDEAAFDIVIDEQCILSSCQ